MYKKMKDRRKAQYLSGYDCIYLITDDAQIYSYTKTAIGNWKIRRLKQRHNNVGYLTVPLKINGKSKTCLLHRLLAGAFIPNPHNKPHVNHLNGQKNDNRLDNLEWCTASENMQHAIINRLHTNWGEGSVHARLKSEQVLYIQDQVGKQGVNRLASKFGISPTTISAIQMGKIWKQLNPKFKSRKSYGSLKETRIQRQRFQPRKVQGALCQKNQSAGFFVTGRQKDK